MEASNLKLTGTSATKPPLGVVPDHALVGVSRVLEDSSVKYSPGNFLAQSIEDAIAAYDSALQRHRLTCRPLSGVVTPAAYAALDDDSGLPHIDHMIAGLLILRTLMIRDGVLPEDPGMGKRKRASVEAQRAVEASYHMPIAPGDAPCTYDVTIDDETDERAPIVTVSTRADAAERMFFERELVKLLPLTSRGDLLYASDAAKREIEALELDEDAPNAKLRDLAERIAKREYDAHNEPAPTVVIESRKIGEEWYVCQEHQSDTCLHDPDTERRLAAERNLEQLRIEQARLGDQKWEWEHRCLDCSRWRRLARPGYTVEDAEGAAVHVKCATCKGTGQRTGAEGVRQ